MHGLQANNREGEVLLRWNDAFMCLKMLNGTETEWHKKAGNEAENGIFIFQSDFYHMLY